MAEQLTVGKRRLLGVKVYRDNDEIGAFSAPVWTVSDSTRAVVDAEGKLRGLVEGTVTVTAAVTVTDTGPDGNPAEIVVTGSMEVQIVSPQPPPPPPPSYAAVVFFAGAEEDIPADVPAPPTPDTGQPS